MFQDLEHAVYHNSFEKKQPADCDTVLLYEADAVFGGTEGGVLTLPSFGTLPPELRDLPLRYGFSLDSRAFFLADAAGRIPPDRLVSSRVYRQMGPAEEVFACAVGESLHRWYLANRFCGRCGHPMQDSETERARVCPDCGMISYPKICPAVIVAVHDSDRLLLTRYRGRAFKRYALVAGFNEIGEPIEETVRREVFEETGLRVKNLRFYKSQPWVFTDSLLMGFFCELDGSDRITLQEDELSEAAWFRRDEIPADHSNISLTGEMIEVFRQGRLPDCRGGRI